MSPHRHASGLLFFVCFVTEEVFFERLQTQKSRISLEPSPLRIKSKFWEFILGLCMFVFLSKTRPFYRDIMSIISNLNYFFKILTVSIRSERAARSLGGGGGTYFWPYSHGHNYYYSAKYFFLNWHTVHLGLVLTKIIKFGTVYIYFYSLSIKICNKISPHTNRKRE